MSTAGLPAATTVKAADAPAAVMDMADAAVVVLARAVIAGMEGATTG
ncbi:hypothetical protein IW254_000507 [Corynebacterium aquatimens]|uniref:Uncharacterized protein n=1 Tax=Corynebacterium aquatimens TaxID=1190508 RepID=A0A931DZH2_9CORY|nr:hypothetical protein [Corynebacterium aquatimens]MBG6121538.1 hypothetical protein [Corynebacterium aquatimens]